MNGGERGNYRKSSIKYMMRNTVPHEWIPEWDHAIQFESKFKRELANIK